jgi:hypothetical protein
VAWKTRRNYRKSLVEIYRLFSCSQPPGLECLLEAPASLALPIVTAFTNLSEFQVNVAVLDSAVLGSAIAPSSQLHLLIIPNP